MTTEELTCRRVDEEELASRYVAGRLSPDDSSRFEEHYLMCPRCQAELRLAVAVRGAVTDPALPQRRPRPPALVWLGSGIGLAAAAAVVALMFLGPGRSARAVRALGGVAVPPVYLGVQVRAPASEADSMFSVAMSAYSEGRYADAAAGLRSALAGGVDAAPAEFFLASSLLMLGQDREAAEAYRRVIALGETPYAPEARFYLAKALLRRGDARAAREQLEEVARRGDELGTRAAALADSVKELDQR